MAAGEVPADFVRGVGGAVNDIAATTRHSPSGEGKTLFEYVYEIEVRSV